MSMRNSIDNIIDHIKEVDSPLCIELDGDVKYVPDDFSLNIKTPWPMLSTSWGSSDGAQKKLLNFNKAVIDITYDKVAAMSLSLYSYLAYGDAGIKTFIATIKHAKEKKMKVICDAGICDGPKGTERAMEAFFGVRPSSNGTLLPAIYDPTAVTIGPYMDYDSFTMVADLIRAYRKCVFFRLKTSKYSRGDGSIEMMRVSGPDRMRPLYEILALRLHDYTVDQMSQLLGEYEYYPIGFMMTDEMPILHEMRKMYPSHFMMIKASKELDKYSWAPAFRRSDNTGALIVIPTDVLLGINNHKYMGMKWNKTVESVVTDTNAMIRSTQEQK